MRGRRIALVGTSSVGRTSVAEQLQALLPEPHLIVGIDTFLNMFPHHWAGHPARTRTRHVVPGHD